MPLAQGDSAFHDDEDKKHPHHSTASAQQEHLSLVHEQGTSTGSSGTGTVPVAPSQNFGSVKSYIIQKQRFLRTLGYSVVVDGVWGPASQAAWNAYLQKRGQSSGAHINIDHDIRLLRQFNRRRSVAEARAAAQLAATRARLANAQRNVQHLHDVERQRQTGQLNTRIAAGSQTGLPNDETELIIREQRREARIYTPDQRTIAAGQVERLSVLLADPRTRRRTLAGMSAGNLRTILFDPEFGHFSSDSPAYVKIAQGFLREHGHKDVKEDGILDQKTLNGLMSEMRRLEVQEHRAAVATVRDLFYSPTLALDLTGLPGFHGKDAPTARELLARMRQGDMVAERLLREVFRRLSTRELGAMRAKYLKATVQEKQERQMSLQLMQQAQRDAQEHSFLGMVMRPFDWMSDQVQIVAIQSWDILNHPTHIWQGDDFEKKQREYAGKLGVWQYEHPYLSILPALLADPTTYFPGKWFAAPFVVAGRGAATSARFLETAGFRLSETGRITKLPGIALTLPARTGRLPSQALRQIERAGLHPDMAGVGDLLAYRIKTEVQHATRLLSVTRRAAHLRTASALRHGFNVTAGRMGVTLTKTPKVPTELAGRYDDSFLSAVKNVDAPAPDIVAEMVRLRQSVFAHVEDGEELTHVGAVLQANIEASVRMDAVLELAESRAEQAASALRSRSEHALVDTEADRVFAETIEGAGPFVLGHGDPELTAILDPLVMHRVQSIKQLYLPAIQKRIEVELEQLGLSLWDETGAFLPDNNAGDVLRRLGADAYDDANLLPVKNPLYGKFFRHQDAVEYAGREFRIRIGAKQAWFSRMKAAGEDIPEDWLGKQSDALRAELDTAWVEVRSGAQKGLWTDTRTELRVPEFQARQYAAFKALKFEKDDGSTGVSYARLARKRSEKGGQEVFRLSDLARQPGQRIDKGDVTLGFYNLQEQVDNVASAFRFTRPEGDEFLSMELPESVFRLGDQPLERQASAMSDFQDAFSLFEKDYDEAYQATYAQALAREGAVYQALRFSQHRPLRMLFNRMEGWLAMWRFAALPLKSGWTAVNFIDNSVKALLQGVVNPKFWFRSLEGGGEGMLRASEAAHSVFEAGWTEIRHVVGFFDTLFGTAMTTALDEAFDHFWRLPYAVHERLFKIHGFDFPEDMLKMAQQSEEIPGVFRTAEQIAEGLDKRTFLPIPPRFEASLARFRKGVWEMFGNKPENFAKRALYYKTLDAARADGKGLLESNLLAWDKVTETLFDYSAISTFEDNVKFLIPFVQWARKNNVFWLTKAARRPGLALGVSDAYSDFRAQFNEDLPVWAQRYMPLRWASDVVARVPALAWMAGPLADSVTDPINLLSVKNLYRFFKQENPNLPEDQAGWKFTDGFVSALEDFGFSMNPLVRKPLEMFGVLDLRSWQSIFPQTSLVEAFTRKFWSDRFPNGINLERWAEDHVLELMGKEPTAKHAAENFDTYVRMEMAAQAARGEALNQPKAEEKIRDWFLVQALVGYFTGIYVRRLTPEDIYYSQIAEDLSENGLAAWHDLTDAEKINYRLWKKRKDEVQWERYVEALPLVRAFYAIPNYMAAREFLKEHPEVMPFVEENFRTYEGGTPGYVAQNLLLEQTDLAHSLWQLEDVADLPPHVADLADKLLVTPELRRFWSLNDTAKDIQERMLRAQYFRHLKSQSDAFHAIPETDYDARKSFLDDHPGLVRSWTLNNSNSDDFKIIVNGVQADLRDRYFEFADAGDWGSAQAFLAAFPFTFDHFDSKGNFVKDRLTGRSQNQHAALFGKSREALAHYFSMPSDDAARWLAAGSHEANLAAQYLDTYGAFRGGSQGGMTQHARDYLAAQKWLDYYFSLSQAQRSAWLGAGSSGAATVLSYFKKYGAQHHFERSFSAAGDAMLATQNAELRSRILFWKRYFELTPDKRPMFVMHQAEEAGIFVYGIFGAKELHDREAAWMRQALAAGMTEKAAAYLFVKPLLDVYFALNKEQRRLFIKANPEVMWYFENYADSESLSGDPRVDKLIESYFGLPDDSQARSLFLHKHPEVQAYFDEHSTPAQRAMRKILNVYFEITDPAKRKEFLRMHPEIQAYFDKRQRERDNEKVQLEAFDNADPRLTDYFAQGSASILPGADRQRLHLAFGSDLGPGLSTRGVAPSDS